MKRSRYAAPYGVWMAIFIIVPMLLVVYYALTTPGGQFTLSHLARFGESVYLGILRRSLWIALLCTLICLAVGYPVALILSDRRVDKKGTLILLFIVPMWMNFLLRTYAWMSLLETHGAVTSFVNNALALVGLGPVRLLYSFEAVLMGMVYNYLPFMILPIYSVLIKIDRRVIEAAEDLGANSARVFMKVRLPLSLPGVVSGITMVFMPAITTFVISRLLGGDQYMLFGDLIEQQFLFTGDWSFGSALSLIMMALILVSMGVMQRLDPGEGGLW